MIRTKFSRYPLQPFLITALEHIGFMEPTEIQERIIPKALKGVSVVGQSQTGTGKTHAFLLPILSKIEPEHQKVQAIITAPTRELANQIYYEVNRLLEFSEPEKKITARLFIGGQEKTKAIEKLKAQPHIVVGTPGRIRDLVNEGALLVHTAEMMVVDEADLMLELGFLEEVDKIAGRLPENVQMYVFSATIPKNLHPFLKKYLENPLFVQVNPKQITADKIEHWLIPVRHRDKIALLTEVLQTFNPYLAIVFCNTKERVDEVADELALRGIRPAVIHGDIPPRTRKKVMNQIRNLEYQFIVATDLASRGIDIEGVSHVINYELPRDLKYYVHRSGRTGRGEFSGISAILYSPEDEQAIQKLEKMGIDFKSYDLMDGEWTKITNRRDREKKGKTTLQAQNYIPAVKKPKKVKPGYKKKMKQELEKMRRKRRPR